MNDSVRLTARPKLNSPNLIAAWPGIGHVAMLVVNYLEKKLDFRKLAGLMNTPAALIDARGIIDKASVEESGLIFKGVGRPS